ncbi:MAG: DNA translocase FtsK [Firmicutes bacterium]|nr:DNA translocase FtsK [Bacillota bacterium]
MGLYIVGAAGVIISLLLILNTPLSSLIDNAKIRRKARKEARELAREEQDKLDAIEAQKKEESSRAAAAATITGLKTPKEVQQKVDTDQLPKLDMAPVRNFQDQDETAQIPAAAVPENRFTPEDIGLKTPEKQRLVVEGITENQQKVLDMVMDDDLFSGGVQKNAAASAAAAPVSAQPDAAEEDRSVRARQARKTSEVTAEDRKKADETIGKEIQSAARQPESSYKYPPIDLLSKGTGKSGSSIQTTQEQARLLEDTLASFGVSASVIDVVRGPAVTRFEVQPATGVKVSKIASLHDDLALNLRAKSLRIEAPIPGKAAVGIEVSNDTISTVTLREIIESQEFKQSKSKISVAIGRSIGGDSIVADLKSMPHLLVAGSTGSGKSVCINSMIVSLLYKANPEEVKLILIDPKVVELSIYNGIPHLMIPVVTDAAKASAALGWAVSEMNDRYNKFAAESVRDLQSYNETMLANGENDKVLPQIVIIIDELAELIMTAKNTVEDSICRIAQKARAAGMHLIVATQRPSTDVITGVIKANIPSRIAFAVSSQTDSRVILDVGGAEHLLGKGDMLYGPQSISKPLRVQGCFISDNEVRSVINFVKEQYQMANYNEDIIHAMNNAGVGPAAAAEEGEEDDLLTDAIETVVKAEQCSVSMLQRRFRIGYNRAARLVDLMEERGIVGPPDGARPRKVLMTLAEFQRLEAIANDTSDSPVEDLID